MTNPPKPILKRPDSVGMMADYLEAQRNLARRGIRQSLDNLTGEAVSVVTPLAAKPSKWIAAHPGLSLGLGVVGGFATAMIFTPSQSGNAVGERAPIPNSSPIPPTQSQPKGGLLQRVWSLLFPAIYGSARLLIMRVVDDAMHERVDAFTGLGTQHANV